MTPTKVRDVGRDSHEAQVFEFLARVNSGEKSLGAMRITAYRASAGVESVEFEPARAKPRRPELRSSRSLRVSTNLVP